MSEARCIIGEQSSYSAIKRAAFKILLKLDEDNHKGINHAAVVIKAIDVDEPGNCRYDKDDAVGYVFFRMSISLLEDVSLIILDKLVEIGEI